MPFGEICSHFPTISTKPYFLISTRFTHFYYLPGSCRHLSLLLLGTILTVLLFAYWKLICYSCMMISRVSLAFCSLNMIMWIRSQPYWHPPEPKKWLLEVIVLLGLSCWINMPGLAYSCSWGKQIRKQIDWGSTKGAEDKMCHSPRSRKASGSLSIWHNI